MKFSCLVSQKAPGSDIETPEKYLTIRADGGENVLQLLSYAAQTEREFIRQRQADGIPYSFTPPFRIKVVVSTVGHVL
jgi:hypothetical protein